MNKNNRKTAYIISHTHWDREWRWPIWQTRQMLLDFMDHLVDILESDKYKAFLLDGQVVPVLDYLEFRPEMYNRIKSLVQSRKLQIGPWYTLPDEYPVDGEALVRNLLWGISESEKLGCVLNLGYTSFGWGQTAQLPQIYTGFGIDVAMVGKKVSRSRAPDSEFVWRGPDGSEMLATRFGKDGRGNFYMGALLSILFGTEYEGTDWEYDWSNGGIAYHCADRDRMEQDHFRLNTPNQWSPEMITPDLLEKIWATTDDSVLNDNRLMMNGCDYSAAQPLLNEILKKFNTVDSDKDRNWVQASMLEYVDVMKKNIDISKLHVVQGELRDGPAGQLTGNALSTRLYLKRLNKHAQNMLIKFAEPMAAIAKMAGASYPDIFIKKAWEFLLQSHPHDSINGVTQDKTVHDVENRLNQVIEISQVVGERSMQYLVSHIDSDSFDDKDVLLVVFNPLPYERQEIIEAWVNMPDDQRKNVFWRAYRPSEGVQVFDADGNPLNTQNQGSSKQTYCVSEVLHTRAFPYNCLRHRIIFDTGKIPACGYKIFRAAPIDESKTADTQWSDSLAQTGTLLKSSNKLENEHLIVEVNPNGTFNLTDKDTGKVFCDLNHYQDRGELGDYWFNERPAFDRIITSLGCSAEIWVEEAGPLQATIVSEITMRIPKKADRDKCSRSSEKDNLTIRTSITLRKEKKLIEVNVEFENSCQDHSLRAMFPIGLSNAKHAESGGHFNVDSRPITPQGPTDNSIWPDMATQPMNNFVNISDESAGIAFLSGDLTEYEVIDHDDRTVALSLLRAVKNWICTEIRVGSSFPSQKGGQCLGNHKIRYAIMPHSGNWQQSEIPLNSEIFTVPLRTVQTRKNKGLLPSKSHSFFEIENTQICFSGIKKAHNNDHCIIRLYNPEEHVLKTDVIFDCDIAEVWKTNLKEERQQRLGLEDDRIVEIVVKLYEILTIEVRFR